MTERWFEDLPEHDPDDPEEVARALRRQERAGRRSAGSRGGRSSRNSGSSGDSGGDGDGSDPGRDTGAAGESLRKHRSGRPAARRRGGRPGGPRRGPLVLLGLLGVLVIGVVWFAVALFQPFGGEGEGEPFTVKVPRGASVGEIGDLLADRGVISNTTFFKLRATISGKRADLSHGNHQFREDMSYAATLDELAKTTVDKTITVTIPEGLSRSETAATVRAAGLPGKYMKATVRSPHLNPDRYGANGKAKNLEGFLFPATYELKPGADVDDLVGQQLGAFVDNTAGINLTYSKKKNLSVYDVLTIASMVEREVSVPKERPKVAAVIYNRLKMDEPLYIDATIRFAVNNWAEPLKESELAVDSPYNTRTHAGLPPGPIGSPGLASIKAAANPARTDAWLYVVEPGTCGEHVFADSLAEHNANVEAYEQAQEEAGGSPTDCP